MITDNKTDFVYFSKWFQKDFPDVYKHIDIALSRFNVDHGLLPHTQDYWCRDYMPAQITEDIFIQYKYDPDYLHVNKATEYYITEPSKTCESIEIETIKTDIIIDGGNIVKCDECVIMTDKIFVENKDRKEIEIVRELERLFQTEIVFLPMDSKEKYGHSDGIVHFLGDKRILLTNYKQFDACLYSKYCKILSKYFDIVELEYPFSKPNEYSWGYINFLQTKDVILLPKFNIKEDDFALEQIASIYSEYNGRIVQIDLSDIIKYGGALNCLSWNIKKKSEKMSQL